MKKLEATWRRHDAAWRDPAQISSQWEEAARVDRTLLAARATGRFWQVLDRARITLLVTREYEHLVLALTVSDGRPRTSFFPIPHPSGLAWDAERKRLYLASTRNPNQILELAPVSRLLERPLGNAGNTRERMPPVLVPLASRFYPGCTYLHDLALVGGRLHANAVGENAVVRVEEDGCLTRVFWPKCIETPKGPLFERNHLQLNSIAAGPTLEGSFFTASTDEITLRRPGHRNFPVDGRGVVFSGRTREPIARGLTRPHSARLHRGKLWVANSGYGELGRIEGGRFEATTRLPGWTRGLALKGSIAFVGTSRVIPRFSRYAPGLSLANSRCAVHAIDVSSGEILGSLHWPRGNQIFAIDCAPRRDVTGFPFSASRLRPSEAERRLFYAFSLNRLDRMHRRNRTHRLNRTPRKVNR